MGCGGELSADDSEVSNGVSETVDNEKTDNDEEKPKATATPEITEVPKDAATPTPEPVEENVSPLEAYTIDGNTVTFHAVSDTFTGSFVIEALEKATNINEGITIIFEEGIEHIADEAFIDFENEQRIHYIKKIVLPNGLETIGNYAFFQCWLDELVLPDSVNSIGYRAFNWCDNLIYEPDSYAEWWLIENEYIDGNPQRKCTIEGDTLTFHAVFDYPEIGFVNTDDLMRITNVIVEDGIKFTSSNILRVNPYITNIILPDSVVCIKDSVINFEDMVLMGSTTLKSIILSDNLEYIGDFTFYKCTALEDITLPNSLKYIGERAFYGCTSLKEVTIPASVTYIGEDAFGDRTSNIKFNYEKGSYAETYLRDNGYIN